MAKRDKPKFIEYVLAKDAEITKKVVGQLLTYTPLKSLKTHCKALEWSCHGVVWLAAWVAFIWLLNDEHQHEKQINMLFGLIFDIVAIAVLKATFRRRRPTASKDMMQLGPDKFSFPSGHASRAVFVTMFFVVLCPTWAIWWLPLMAWCFSVCFSRIIIQRHYILDVVAGMVLGCLEAGVIALLWIGKDTATSMINYISNDNLPGGEE